MYSDRSRRGIHIDTDRLRDARERAGLSIAQLANLVGVNRAHLSNVERGDRRPSPEVAVRVAQALGVGIDDLRPALPDAA